MGKRYDKVYLSQVIRENIKKYRQERNLTQQDIADLTNLSHGYIRDLECPSRNKTPRIETLGLIANAFNIDIELLFKEKQNFKDYRK